MTFFLNFLWHSVQILPFFCECVTKKGRKLTQANVSRSLKITVSFGRVQQRIDDHAQKVTSAASRMAVTSEWVSSFLTAHQHIIGYSVPQRQVTTMKWFVLELESWRRPAIGAGSHLPRVASVDRPPRCAARLRVGWGAPDGSKPHERFDRCRC